VRRWKEKVSDAGAEKLGRYLKRQETLTTRRKADKNRIHELMKLADVEGKLPSIKAGTKVRSGRQTIGVQHVKNFKIMLSLDVLDDIDVWLHSLKKRYTNWQLLAIISQYGVGEHRGYKTVYYQLAPDAGDFAISANVATHATTSLREAESSLREKLEAVIEGSKVIAFLHSVTAFNYNKRKPEEMGTWETLQRRKREEKAKRWHKKEEKTMIAELSEENERLRRELQKTKKKAPSSTDKPSKKKAKKKAKTKTVPTTGWWSHPTSQPSSRSSQPSKTTVRAQKSKRAQPSAPKASKASTKKSKPSLRQSSTRKPSRARSTLTSVALAKRSKKVSSKKKTTKRKS
jgi:hypothetical protein